MTMFKIEFVSVVSLGEFEVEAISKTEANKKALKLLSLQSKGEREYLMNVEPLRVDFSLIELLDKNGMQTTCQRLVVKESRTKKDVSK